MEYIQLLREYEQQNAQTKTASVEACNVYNDGIGVVEKTNIPWSRVVGMETQVKDPNHPLDVFLTRK